MIKKLFEPFAARGTRFRNKFRHDAFLRARLQIMLLYFTAGTLTFVLFGWFLGRVTRAPFYTVAIQENGRAVELAIQVLETRLLFERILMLAIFAITSFFLAEFVLRPIKKSAERQKRFAAIVSHELRTPVTIIRNASEIALRDPSSLSREKAIALIQSNLEETNRLADTIQFLLSFSSLESKEQYSSMVPMSLTDLTQKLLPLLEKLAEPYHIRIFFKGEGKGLLLGNATALEGILLNLVKNALTSSPPESIITVSIEDNGALTNLIVTDAGKGMSKEELGSIFEPFYKGTSGGAGLGLSIVKEVAELHHATIGVQSTTGKGTTFTLSFPHLALSTQKGKRY
jgi:signal transduction histidine kinase